MKRNLILMICLFALNSAFTQTGFITANQYFDDGRKGSFISNNKRTGDLIVGIIEDNTGEYVTYRKVAKKPDGSPVTIADIIPGKGIYRKKDTEYFRLNFDGPVNIRWFGAVGDGKTDNSESIRQALSVSSLIKIPLGDFAIANSIAVNSAIDISGAGTSYSKIICLDKNKPAFVLAENSSVKNLSLLRFSNFSIVGGKFGITAERQTGNQLIIERSNFQNLNFEGQSTAAMFFRGKNLLFLVNTLQENAFRYCGGGIWLDDVFSANLNHILLNRFEGTAGGIRISTTNNEMSQLTIDKNRFEAIVSKENNASPILLSGGNQNVSISHNYFEDVPDPVIHIDAGKGLSISPSIVNNQFSANINGPVMLKLSSQVKSPYIVSNVFKPGQKGTRLDLGSSVSQPFIQSNHGNVEFVSYPIPYSDFENRPVTQQSKANSFKQTISHSGNFKFEHKLPGPGIYDVSIAISEDGDFGLGGFSTYKLVWLKADAPIYLAQEVISKNNPNTAAITMSAPNAQGTFIVDVKKADRKTRQASCFINVFSILNIDLTNTQNN